MSDREAKLAELAAILAAPDMSTEDTACARARSARTAAVEAAKKAEADLAAIFRKHDGRGHFGGEHPAIVAARKELERAEKTRLVAAAAYGVARERREQQFMCRTSEQLTEAAPILAEFAELFWKVAGPLVELHTAAWRGQLPTLAVLQQVPALQEGARVLQAIANRAANAAAPGSDDD